MPVAGSYRPCPVFPALGPAFFDVVAPARFPLHRLRHRDQRWAARIGLDTLDASEWERHFAAFAPLPANLTQPLALRYHGHQFRAYNPALGDGRGFLYAQLRDVVDDRLLDLGTKGSGQTPWSRDGDGRLTLKGGVREVLATEMLEALGVYTSKSVSLFETGEMLFRGDEPSPTRSSVLVRLGHSHVRFGTFQRYAYLNERTELRASSTSSSSTTGPGGRPATRRSPSCRVVARSARLCASWMMAGFVHGVLNTDNMNVTGESFDYGPYRFLPTYDPEFTAAYFDPHGLYAFGRQPATVEWNLEQLAKALGLLGPRPGLEAALERFPREYEQALVGASSCGSGSSRGPDDDAALGAAVFEFLAESQVGFEQFFFDWYGGAASAARALASPASAHYAEPRFTAVRRRLDDHDPLDPARLGAAYYQRPRPCTLLIDEIEALWDAIAARDDWSLFTSKLAAIDAMRLALGLAASATSRGGANSGPAGIFLERTCPRDLARNAGDRRRGDRARLLRRRATARRPSRRGHAAHDGGARRRARDGARHCVGRVRALTLLEPDAEVLVEAPVVLLVGEVVAHRDPVLVADLRTTSHEADGIVADGPAQAIVRRGDRFEDGRGDGLGLPRARNPAEKTLPFRRMIGW